MAYAQKGSKPPPAPERTILPDFGDKGTNTPVFNILKLGTGENLDVVTVDTVWMDFSIDWTNYQIHRVNDDSPIEIILPGTIDGSNTLHWNLTSCSPVPGGMPNLYFVEDALGRTGPVYGSEIPLTWEISLDGGPFTPLTLQPDNTLTTVFPPGQHTFQVRITGLPEYHQSDGYYKLQLEQCIVPEL